ncbi:hypothetical protein LH430_00075 [Laribacter hongkongensis]|nr:hypothetical protein [Laribacter hongkongensis]MCG8998930.1 hypothetical protein [Laribacter hongkongensis]MCG9012462.1 hypothetical protein [Laribacter hongkongensis]MCG9018344.1 hypothetical protein [Laribacter hongkongensis]
MTTRSAAAWTMTFDHIRKPHDRSRILVDADGDTPGNIKPLSVQIGQLTG